MACRQVQCFRKHKVGSSIPCYSINFISIILSFLGRRKMLPPPGIEPPSQRKEENIFDGVGKKNCSHSGSNHRPSLQWECIFESGEEKNLASTWDRTSDLPKNRNSFQSKKIGILFNPKKEEFFLILKGKIFSKNTRFVRNFLTKKRFVKNSDFFTKCVFKLLLGGMKTISVIY